MSTLSIIWVSIFILDFVSTWFTVYSKYLAGDRTKRVSKLFENILLSVYRYNVMGFCAVDVLAELFITTQKVSNSKVLVNLNTINPLISLLWPSLWHVTVFLFRYSSFR